jgi:hypothetical protein
VVAEELQGMEVLEEVTASPDGGRSGLSAAKLGGGIQIPAAWLRGSLR